MHGTVRTASHILVLFFIYIKKKIINDTSSAMIASRRNSLQKLKQTTEFIPRNAENWNWSDFHIFFPALISRRHFFIIFFNCRWHWNGVGLWRGWWSHSKQTRQGNPKMAERKSSLQSQERFFARSCAVILLSLFFRSLFIFIF